MVEKGLTIIVPAYNEEKGIGGVLKEITEVMEGVDRFCEVMVIDDGSTDNTPMLAKERRDVRLIQHPVNRGYGAAIKTGIKNAKGELILIIDADGTYSPGEIPKLIEHMEHYDMVVGARTGEKVKIPLLRRPGKLILSMLANYLTGENIADLNSGLRIFKKEAALKFFNLLPSRFSFTSTITLAYLSNEYSVKYVPINYFGRKGESKIRIFRDGLNFISLIIRTSIYFNPLKVFLPASALVLFLGLAVFFYQLIFLRDVGSLSVILLLASIQFTFFGLLADLLVRRLK